MGRLIRSAFLILLSIPLILPHFVSEAAAEEPAAIVYLKKDPLPREINHIVAETLLVTIDSQPEPNQYGLALQTFQS